MGEKEKADKEKEFIESHGKSLDHIDNLNRLYKIYLSIQDKNKLIEILEKVVIIKPSGINYARLAAIYKEIGNYTKALSAVEKAVKLDPSLKSEAEKFIQLLK